MSKKQHPDEFKIEALKQLVDAGHCVAEVAGRYLAMTSKPSLFAPLNTAPEVKESTLNES